MQKVQYLSLLNCAGSEPSAIDTYLLGADIKTAKAKHLSDIKYDNGRETDGDVRSSRRCTGERAVSFASFGSTQRTEQVDRIDADAFCLDGDTFSDVYLSGQQRDWCSASFGEEVKQKDCTPYGASSGQLQTSHCSLSVRQFLFPHKQLDQPNVFRPFRSSRSFSMIQSCE